MNEIIKALEDLGWDGYKVRFLITNKGVNGIFDFYENTSNIESKAGAFLASLDTMLQDIYKFIGFLQEQEKEEEE